jgi:hypothetical protein
MSLLILLKLLFAHILADFILQTDRICLGKKEEGSVKYGFQALHAFTHAAVSYLLVAQWENWIIPLVLFVTHGTIDIVKSNYWKETVGTFIADQLLHLAVIVGLWVALFGTPAIYASLFGHWETCHAWTVGIAYLLLLKPSSVFINLFVQRWTLVESKRESLPNAGQWIGYLERILILTFMLAGYFEGIGFLLAAKSIFRFGELSKAKEIRTTEYVLIGTLLSFTMAILIGMATIKIIV